MGLAAVVQTQEGAESVFIRTGDRDGAGDDNMDVSSKTTWHFGVRGDGSFAQSRESPAVVVNTGSSVLGLLVVKKVFILNPSSLSRGECRFIAGGSNQGDGSGDSGGADSIWWCGRVF